jgi:hypothetical protein
MKEMPLDIPAFRGLLVILLGTAKLLGTLEQRRNREGCYRLSSLL